MKPSDQILAIDRTKIKKRNTMFNNYIISSRFLDEVTVYEGENKVTLYNQVIFEFRGQPKETNNFTFIVNVNYYMASVSERSIC